MSLTESEVKEVAEQLEELIALGELNHGEIMAALTQIWNEIRAIHIAAAVAENTETEQH